jgi:hypothetical protein
MSIQRLATHLAIAHGHLECFKILVFHDESKYTATGARDQHDLIPRWWEELWQEDAQAWILCASTHGHLSIVRFLLEEMEIPILTEEAHMAARNHNHSDVIAYLASDALDDGISE